MGSTKNYVCMARYFALLERYVDVQYRAGDIMLPASGKLVADSGRSIFLEQSFEQRGRNKHFRWEIPYQCIIRLEQKAPPEAPATKAAAAASSQDCGSRTLDSENSPNSAASRMFICEPHPETA
ncbi:MAG: hypothetical protein NVS9B4_16990 [Candidatus Acidiferrum sp.]